MGPILQCSGCSGSAQACSGSAQALLRLAQALLRLCSGLLRLRSGSAPACSPSAQVKAAVAHVRRLKRNQRKGKLILSLGVFKARNDSKRALSDCGAAIAPRCRSSETQTGLYAVVLIYLNYDNYGRTLKCSNPNRSLLKPSKKICAPFRP